MSDGYRERNLLCGSPKGLAALHTLNPDYVYLATQHAGLMRENIDLNKRVSIFDPWSSPGTKSSCLYEEAIKRPEERARLLTRISRLMEEVRIV